MKLSWGLLACSALGQRPAGGPFNERPGQCPEELPNQPDFDPERYLGVWQTHLTNDDENIDADQRCTVATYSETDSEDTIQVINTSTNDARGVFQFAIGTGVQQNANNQLFVSFSEVGQCPSYDQFSNGKIGCFTLPRPPVAPEEQFENYRVFKTDYENYALVGSCYNIDESTHKEILYVLVRSKACWADRNTEFINEQLNFLEEVGLYTGDLRDVSQDNCDGDGIDRNLCDDYEYDMSTGLAAKTAFLLLAFACFL